MSSILHRRKRLRIKKEFELPLTSMMDMLIIILIFLLKSYTSTSVVFSSSDKIALPQSLSTEVPEDAIHVIIEPTGIIIDSKPIVEFVNTTGQPYKKENATYQLDPRIMADGGRRILPLYDELVKARENAELMMSKAVWVKPADAQNPNAAKEVVKPKFQGVLTIQADKSVRYETIRKVMYTAGAAQYRIFKLIGVKKEG